MKRFLEAAELSEKRRKEELPPVGRGTGTVLCYNGRRQTGRLRTDDGEELVIPSGGAVNRNMVPLTPSGLMCLAKTNHLP